MKKLKNEKKIEIFEKNRNFWKKIENFENFKKIQKIQKFCFLSPFKKMVVFEKIWNFRKNSQILKKI